VKIKNGSGTGDNILPLDNLKVKQLFVIKQRQSPIRTVDWSIEYISNQKKRRIFIILSSFGYILFVVVVVVEKDRDR
jgi:hypothetical protein